MTMPHLGNCPHKPGTWCLPCVKEEWERREVIEAAKDAELSRLTSELAAMRERCERLTNECFWTRSLCDIKDHDRKHAEMIRARVQVDLYNDLTPPKETSDGH